MQAGASICGKCELISPAKVENPLVKRPPHPAGLAAVAVASWPRGAVMRWASPAGMN